MRVVVLTDVHANLVALEAALSEIRQRGYDLLVHTGDAIGLGPFPAETLDLLLSLPRTVCLMGNHEAWFVDGLPQPQPAWMSDGEVAHQQWTHQQLSADLRAEVARWSYVLSKTIGGVPITLLHYALDAPGSFAPIIRDPTVADLDRLFASYHSPLIFYGHHHPKSDIRGRARYINPGSLGCSPTAEARYCVVEVEDGGWTVEHCRVPYDDAALFAAFEGRRVPERAFIYQAFFGGRFGA